MSQWVELDRRSDALLSLEMFGDCLKKAHENQIFWKWSIVSIHNALQAYVCMSLRGGSSFRTWRERDLKKWMIAYDNNEQLPDPNQDIFMNLYDKLFNESEQVDREKINSLNTRRNELIHFNQDGWSFLVADLHSYCSEALKATRLAPDLANGMVFYRNQEREDFERILQHAEFTLNSMDNSGGPLDDS